MGKKEIGISLIIFISSSTLSTLNRVDGETFQGWKIIWRII